jgi:hypothetical protein
MEHSDEAKIQTHPYDQPCRVIGIGGSHSHSPGDMGYEALGSQKRSHEMRKRQASKIEIVNMRAGQGVFFPEI